ncbi:hypothetical protein, partial [Lysinibacillus sp. D4A3_S15]|uniref:hypothetical protein n=1 Tax=Lysinibacillus sp. D4A3_S15 TaxID=2941227 RepID=UPI0020C0FF4A
RQLPIVREISSAFSHSSLSGVVETVVFSYEVHPTKATTNNNGNSHNHLLFCFISTNPPFI